MMNKFILSLLVGLSILAQAATVSELTPKLDAEDRVQRGEARAQMQSLFASASAADLPQLEQQLLSELNDATSKASRQWLIRMLEWFGSDAAIPALRQELATEDSNLRDCARRALSSIGTPNALKALASIGAESGYANALAQAGSGANAILPLLKSSDPAIVIEAINALGDLRSKAAFAELAERWGASQGEQKVAIESAMLKIGLNAAAAKALALKGSTDAAQAGALLQLAALDPAAAQKVLNKHRTPALLRAAMQTPALQTGLVADLGESSESEQAVIFWAIANFGLSQFETDVLTILPSTTGIARSAALHALGWVGGDASFDTLISNYQETEHPAALDAIGRLQAPQADAKLIAAIRNTADEAACLSAVKLAALRNPDGALNHLHQLLSEGTSDAIRKETCKTLSLVGNVESAKKLSQVIARQSVLKRDAQKNLRKLCATLKVPAVLWQDVFSPALQSATSDAVSKDLLNILDGANCQGAVAHLNGLLVQPASPLHATAVGALSRFPVDPSTIDSWVKLTNAEGISESASKTAARALKRLKPSHQWGDSRRNVDTLARAIPKSSNSAFLDALLTQLKEVVVNQRLVEYAKTKLKKSLDDPELGPRIKVALGEKAPESADGTAIFDGKSLNGWKIMPKPETDGYYATEENFFVKDGAINCFQLANKNGGLIMSEGTYQDFELSIDINNTWGNDSGIILRTNDEGCGIQILNDYLQNGSVGYLFGQGTGGYFSNPVTLDGKSGTVIGKDSYNAVEKDKLVYAADAATWNKAWNTEGWNTMKIRCVGTEPMITTWINGTKIMEMNGATCQSRQLREVLKQNWDAKPAWDSKKVLEITNGGKGRIALQVHPGRRWTPGSSTQYKNIRIKEL